MTRGWGALVAAAGLLAGCAGQVVPPGRAGSTAAAPPPRSAARPAPAAIDLSSFIREAPRTPTLPVRQPQPAVPIAAVPFVPSFGASTAAQAGVVAGPPLARLPIGVDQARAALTVFRAGCPSLARRTDTSGLTRPSDWQAVCAAAQGADGDPLGFFASQFETVQVGDGRAYATGYYVPEIDASLTHRPGYDAPIYARPNDLIDVDLSQFNPALKGKSVRGRVDGQHLVPYYDRAAIDAGAIDGRARVLAWARDPVALFFLQVQGSGQLRLPDGRVLRIGYDSQNGRDYTGIGSLMRQRGLVGPNQLSMQGIVGWLHEHPDEARGVMDANKSFVFFRPLAGDPVGAMGLPVVGGVSAAVDAHFIPMGAPFFLSMDRVDATSLWVAQDTGGAIKGANRVDTFWGTGGEAAAVAGGMSARGTAVLLLPVGTLARLGAAGAGPAPQP